MIELKNDRLLRAIRHQPVDRTPIWIMRQAGRYLPEYRAVRQRAGSFMALCKNPELACEVTLQPLARFSLDAAIVFSDILTIPDAMGLGLQFIEGKGPIFAKPLRSEKDIQNLAIPDPDISLRYVLDAIRLITRELAGKVPLIGFCGSPWTLATYMIEGGANKSFPLIQKMLQEQPQALHQLLHKLAEAVALHLDAQIKSGAQVVMIFDTWGGMLNTADYQAYSLHYIRQIIRELGVKNAASPVPVVLFTKAGGQWLELMAESQCDVIAVDWLVNLKDARQRVGNKIALQGNLNPTILCQTESVIRAEVARILTEYGSGSGHIFNLGHGITPEVPPEHVAILVDAVHTLSHRDSKWID
ncbi:MAG: uroporphyrinogen decarboxylase [Gammaproteobacteria bacterium]|jgi:uroporphyrinogen decarboxylase|nr:uroporphyrinogen decarboxylase [Gammaproteobacteria bacterium]